MTHMHVSVWKVVPYSHSNLDILGAFLLVCHKAKENSDEMSEPHLSGLFCWTEWFFGAGEKKKEEKWKSYVDDEVSKYISVKIQLFAKYTCL